jgi:hypothetical protein
MKIDNKSVKDIDCQVRQFWRSKGYKINSDYYFAATSSCNWYGFIEGVNDCVENPTWEEIKGFVQYYCTHLKKEYQSYHELYNELERQGYSPVLEKEYVRMDKNEKSIFKELKQYGFKNIKSRERINKENIDKGFYKCVFDFYKSNYPSKLKK